MDRSMHVRSNDDKIYTSYICGEVELWQQCIHFMYHIVATSSKHGAHTVLSLSLHMSLFDS